MTSSVISFAYFKHFSNLNISGTIAGICKRETAFSFFHRILCDAPKKSRGKNLILNVLALQTSSPPSPPGNSNPFCGGVSIFSGTAQLSDGAVVQFECDYKANKYVEILHVEALFN